MARSLLPPVPRAGARIAFWEGHADDPACGIIYAEEQRAALLAVEEAGDDLEHVLVDVRTLHLSGAYASSCKGDHQTSGQVQLVCDLLKGCIPLNLIKLVEPRDHHNDGVPEVVDLIDIFLPDAKMGKFLF